MGSGTDYKLRWVDKHAWKTCTQEFFQGRLANGTPVLGGNTSTTWPVDMVPEMARSLDWCIKEALQECTCKKGSESE